MAPRDEDVRWNFGDSVDGNKHRIKCKFCNKIINRGITRLKQHLAQVKRDMMSLLMKYKD
ncbi:Peptide-N(4)-(N-acetyl-beta-glucosaminyl)asparagine amidase [Bienertia sinuspersici]